jgi:hypothetical protein
MATANLKVTVLQRLQEALAGLGFKRCGSTFRKESGDVVHLVSLQSSQSSTASTLRFTINLAVSVPRLGGQTDDVWSAQWRERIGAVMPDPRDRWWNVSSPREAEAVAQEMAEALVEYGLPAQGHISSAADLLRLWESGKSPGLTAVQAARYVDQLRSSAV